MCWNADVSFNTFSLALFTCILCWINNTFSVYWGVFFLSYAVIQLIEFFLWKNIHNAKWNYLISIIGFVAIMFQPLASILTINDKPDQWRLRDILLCMYSIFVCVILGMIFTTDLIEFKTIVASNGHLQWLWIPKHLIFLLPWMILFFVPIFTVSSHVAITFTCTILLISILSYWKDNTWGSMWCWFASMSSLFYIWQVFVKSGVCLPQ